MQTLLDSEKMLLLQLLKVIKTGIFVIEADI